MKTFVGLRFNKQYTKRNGCAQLYLLIGVNGAFDRHPLDLEWVPTLVDEASNRLLPQRKEDHDCDDYNLIIAAEIGKVNELFKQARLREEVIGLETLLYRLKNFDLRKDFVAYMAAKIEERRRAGEIDEGTAKHQRSTLHCWVVKFRPVVPFHDMTVDFIKKFQAFLRRSSGHRMEKKLAYNTVARQLTTVQTYVNQAIADGFLFENPFKQARGKVKTQPIQGHREWLLPIELSQFEWYYLNTPLPLTRKMVLLEFLISSRTGMRLGDLKTKITRPLVEQYASARGIVFKPKKTQDTSAVTVSLPLNGETIGWMRELVNVREQMRRQGLTMSEQKGREFLKQVAELRRVAKKVTYHVARHTFGTNYIRSGGRLENLMVLMGHSDVKTTMIYVHFAQVDIDAEMKRLHTFYQQLSA